MATIHFFYKSQGKGTQTEDIAHIKNCGPEGTSQAHSSVIAIIYEEPKSDGNI